MSDRFRTKRSSSAQPYRRSPPAHRPMDNGDAEPVLASIDVRRIWTILRRRKWIVLAVAAATTGAAAYMVLTTRPLYMAEAVIRLVDTRRSLVGGLVDAQTDAPSEAAGNNPVLSQIQVLLSRAVVGEVVDSSEVVGMRLYSRGFPDSLLRDVQIHPASLLDSVQLAFTPTEVAARGRVPDRGWGPVQQVAYGTTIELDSLRFSVTKAPGVEQGAIVVFSRDRAIDELLKSLSARPRVDTDVIDVAFTAHNAEAAQRVVNTTVQVFQAVNAQTGNETVRNRRLFVEARLREADSALTDAEQQLAALATQRVAARPQERSAGEQAALTTMETEREELNAERLMYTSLLADLQRSQGQRNRESLRALVSTPGVAESPVLGRLYAQLTAYQTTRDSLTTGPWGSAATHPDVRRLDTLIVATERNVVDAVRSYLTSLDARIAVRDGIKARSARSAPVLSEPEAEENRLRDRATSLGASSDRLREQLQEAQIAAAAEVGQVQIVDLATRPTVPVGVGEVRKIVFGVAIGLLLGGIAAFLVELVDGLNSSIRRRSEIEGMLDVPALGIVPPINADQQNGRWLRIPWRSGNGSDNGNGNGKRGSQKHRSELVTLSQMNSAGAEAYRTLRTNLLFSQAVQQLRTLVVTSATPGEGKTTTAANLAITYAHQGVRVLLVDCDLRRPRAHTVFGIDREPGLTQLLLGRCTAADAIQVAAGNVAGLAVLPAGLIPPNPSELLGGALMRALLETLGRDYELIILDSPPVLLTPDSAVLGAICDGVLLVVRAGKTQQDDAQETVRKLATVDARIVGVVLNDPDERVPKHERRYSYGYYGTEGPVPTGN